MQEMKVLILIVILSSLFGCETQPSRFAGYPKTKVSPEQLAVGNRAAPKGTTMTWGGTIVATKNLHKRTILEVLAYPLDDDGRPQLENNPQGRFLAEYLGYLEPLEYAPGRHFTVSGPMLGFNSGRVGDAAYRFPVLDIRQMQLWAMPADQGHTKPRVGVGVGVSNRGTSVGIGIGF